MHYSALITFVLAVVTPLAVTAAPAAEPAEIVARGGVSAVLRPLPSFIANAYEMTPLRTHAQTGCSDVRTLAATRGIRTVLARLGSVTLKATIQAVFAFGTKNTGYQRADCRKLGVNWRSGCSCFWLLGLLWLLHSRARWEY